MHYSSMSVWLVDRINYVHSVKIMLHLYVNASSGCVYFKTQQDPFVRFINAKKTKQLTMQNSTEIITVHKTPHALG